MKFSYIFVVLLAGVFVLSFTSAEDFGYNYLDPPSYNNNTAFVNESAHWVTTSLGVLSDASPVQFTNSGGVLTILTSYLDAGWCALTGCTMTGDIDMNDNALTNVDHIDFNLSEVHAAQEGRLSWDADDGTLQFGLPGGDVNLQIGQESLIRVKNDAGVVINNGQVVYISGSQGNNIQVKLADNSLTERFHIAGVATEEMAVNGFGYITINGLVRDFDTTGTPVGEVWVEGQNVYLGVGGNLTNTHPPSATAAIVVVGTVTKVHATEGIILVTAPESFTLGNNFNGTLRSSVINKNNGSVAGVGFTAVNDLGYFTTFGMAGSGNLIFGNSTSIFYAPGYGDHLQAVDGAKDFVWLTDPTDSHNNTALDNEVMRLSSNGNLTLNGNMTADYFVGDVLTIANGAYDVSLKQLDKNSFIDGNVLGVIMTNPPNPEVPHFWLQSGGSSQASGIVRSFIIANEDVSVLNNTNRTSCIAWADAFGVPLLIDCNTTTTGADLFVGDDMQVNGEVIMTSMYGNGIYQSVNDMFNLYTSAGSISGGALTNPSGTNIVVQAGEGNLRTADDDISQMKFISWAESSPIAVPLNSIMYFGVDYNSGSPIVYNTTLSHENGGFDLDTQIPLGSAINQGGSIYLVSNPWKTSDAITSVIERFESGGHFLRDEQVGGLIPGYTGTRYLTMTTGKVWGRLNGFDISAFDSSGADTFDSYYRDGAGGYSEISGQSQWNNTYYDDDSGTLQPIPPAAKYANIWIWLNVGDGKPALVFPQQTYSTIAQAEAGEVPSTFPSYWNDGGFLLGRIIIQSGVDAPIAIENVFTQQFSSAQAAEHGNLAGLTDDDHTQYWIENVLRTGDFSTSGNVTASYFIGDVGNFTDLYVSNNSIYIGDTIGLSATNGVLNVTGGNLSAAAFIGDGSQLTGISGGSSLWSNNSGTLYYEYGSVAIGGNSTDAYLQISKEGGSATMPYMKFEQKSIPTGAHNDNIVATINYGSSINDTTPRGLLFIGHSESATNPSFGLFGRSGTDSSGDVAVVRVDARLDPATGSWDSGAGQILTARKLFSVANANSEKFYVKADGGAVGVSTIESLGLLTGNRLHVNSDTGYGTTPHAEFDMTTIPTTNNHNIIGFISSGSSAADTSARGLAFVGHSESTTNSPFGLYARTSTDNTGDAAAITINARAAPGTGDWNAGGGSALSNKKIFSVSNYATELFYTWADGSTTFTDTLSVGTNTLGGLSAGDINVSTIYYDTLTAKSPTFLCSDDWCSVSFPKYQKTLWVQKDDGWNILDIVYEGTHYTKAEFNSAICSLNEDTQEICSRLNTKILNLQDKAIADALTKAEQAACAYNWDENGCYEMVFVASDYESAVSMLEINNTYTEDYSCQVLDSSLTPVSSTCQREVVNGTRQIYNFNEGCNWDEFTGYYCEERLSR